MSLFDKDVAINES